MSLICNEEKENEFGSTSNKENIDIGNNDLDEVDSDYDPNEDKEQEQAVKDEESDIINDEELENDIKEIKNAKKENESALIDINDEDENKLINSEDFGSELVSAFECVEKKAKFDKEKIISMVQEKYMNDTGMEATDEIIQSAMKTFNDNTDDIDIDGDGDEQDIDDDGEQNEEQSADEQDVDDNDDDDDDDIDDEEEEYEEYEEEVDPELFAKEMDDALDNVRKLAGKHQEKLVNKICDTFNELNGNEASTEEIGVIFSGIKEKLSNEARDHFIQINDKEDDENDSDYNPNQDAIQQIELLEESDEEEQENDNDNIENDENDNLQFPTSETQELTTKFKEINVRESDDYDSDYNPNDDGVQQIESLEQHKKISIGVDDDDNKEDQEQNIDENVNTSNMIHV